MFALAAHAGEREAHAREVERSGADWPEGSYGRRNRQAIAARETRVATRLRAIQHAYQAVAGHDTAFTPPRSALDPRHVSVSGQRHAWQCFHAMPGPDLEFRRHSGFIVLSDHPGPAGEPVRVP